MGNYILKNKKLIISVLASLFVISVVFFGPYFFIKGLVGLDINDFNDNRLPPINGECYFDQYSFKNWSEKNIGQTYEIRYKYKFIDIEDAFQDIKCLGKVYGSNYIQGEEIYNLGSYITLNIVRVKYVDLLIISIFLVYLIYFANWTLFKKINTQEMQKILLASFFNTSFLIVLRFFLEEGYTKTFLKNISTFLIFIIFLCLPFFIPKISMIKKKIYENKKIVLPIVLFSLIIPMYLLFLDWSGLFFGKLVYYFFLFTLILQICIYSFFFRNIYNYSNHSKEKHSKNLNIQSFLDLKSLVLIFFTLIPILRFSLGNSQILGINEILGIIVIFFILSFIYIGLVSNVLGKILNNNYFLLIASSTLIIAYELPTITNSFNLRNINWGGYSILAFILVSSFLAALIHSSKKQLVLAFTLFFFIGISNQAFSLINENENLDLEALQKDSAFYSILNEGLSKKYSIVVLVYDGYPQNEFLNLYGINNSDQTNYLIDNGFHIFNGTYSIGSYSLGTMARFFEGTSIKIDEDNSRNIVGGYSSFVKALDDNGYQTAGVFPSSFYFPPNMEPNYDYYFPNKAQRSRKMATSILRGYLTHKDAIYTIPYESYLEEKNKILSTIGNSQDPYFLYTHTYFPGHTQNSGTCLPGEFDEWKKELEYANLEMTDDIALLENNFENSIVIVMGDHGPFLTKNCTSLTDYPLSEITRLDIQDRHSTFLAIRFPDNFISFDVNELTIIQNTLIKVVASLSENPESFFEHAIPSSTPIEPTHLPKEVNVINNKIINGYDNDKYLFEDVSIEHSK